MKDNFFLMFIVFSMASFLTATLLVLFFFKLFPEQVSTVYFIAGGVGLLFGALCYLPFKWVTREGRGKK
jgi:hypothetical protein